MTPRKKTMGKGAVVSCLARMLHPVRVIETTFPNMNNKKRLAGLIVLRKEMKTINRRQQEALICQSDEIMNGDEHTEVYAAVRYFAIVVEGPPDGFFEPMAVNNELPEQEARNQLSDDVFEIVRNRNNNRPADDDDILQVLGELEIDNDNDPAPENRYNINADLTDCKYNTSYGHSGICNRKKENTRNTLPTINFPKVIKPSRIDLFEMFFPKKFLVDVILVHVNNNNKLGKVEYGEFLRWLGLWFIMSTIEGPNRRDFWSMDVIDVFNGSPFRLNLYMSRNRFEDILYSLGYTKSNPPAYNDKFYEIRDLVDAWNEHMSENFTPGWASCLDESMMEWTNQYTCPGFMFVPRKPHPFGNEWHSICCGVSGIMFAVELVEGKDSPPELKKEFETLGKTVGLLLRLTKKLWNTGKLVVLDSGFCVLKGLIELRRRGVFASAVIKKRRYWPKYIDGDEIKLYFAFKDVGHADSIGGTLEDVPFDVFCMKDDGYVNMLMSTYGTNELVGKDKYRVVDGRKMTFKYPEVIANHFTFRHAVDDHNARRHAPISFEKCWGTKYWTDRVFSFLIAVTEVNVLLADCYFNQNTVTSQLDFRKLFAKDLIHNEYFKQEQVRAGLDSRRSLRRTLEADHQLLSLPKKTKFFMGRMVESTCDYPQYKCRGCKKRVRTYCLCTPGEYRCNECYAIHIRIVNIDD